MTIRQSTQYLNCMAAKLPACLQGFCPDGSVCSYGDCWNAADAACYEQAALAQQPELPPPSPTVPPSTPQTATTLGLLEQIYAAAQAAASALPGVPTLSPTDPIPPQAFPQLAPAIAAAVPALSAFGIDPGVIFRDILGYHAAVQNKSLTGDTSKVTWDEVTAGVEAAPAGTPSTKKEEKKSNYWWWVGGAAALVGGIYLATRDQRS